MSDPLIVQGPGLPTVPLVTTSVDAPDPNPPAPRGDTEYVILDLFDEEVQGEQAWALQDRVLARSAEAAVRQHAEAQSYGEKGATLVAVPSRSWKPVKVKPQVVTTTTLVIEDA